MLANERISNISEDAAKISQEVKFKHKKASPTYGFKRSQTIMIHREEYLGTDGLQESIEDILKSYSASVIDFSIHEFSVFWLKHSDADVGEPLFRPGDGKRARLVGVETACVHPQYLRLDARGRGSGG